MATSKSSVLFQLFAITRAPIDDGLDQKVSESIAKEVDKFSDGKKTKTSEANLSALLSTLADHVGTVEVAARVSHRVALDDLTRAASDAATDYVKVHGKETVRAWLIERDPSTSLAKKVSIKKLNAMVVATKQGSWEDEPAQETAAIDQGQVAKAAADTERTEREAVAASATTTTTSKAAPSKALTITEPQAIFVVSKGLTMTGLLNPDATVSFDKSVNGNVSGKTFSSTSKAACAALDVKAANGWLKIQFMDGETKKPIDALRANSKGYEVGTGRRKKVVGVDACKESIKKLETRETYLADALTKTKDRLKMAWADLDEAEGNANTPTGDDGTLGDDVDADDAKEMTSAATTFPDRITEQTREVQLLSMKVKALRTLAKDLNVKGRSKLKTGALVAAILAAEAA